MASTETLSWGKNMQCTVVINPSELPWDSARSSRVTPIHFQPPNPAAQCWASMYLSPLPSQEGLHAVKDICHPGAPLWGSAHTSHVAPVHWRLPTTDQFRASLHVHMPSPGFAAHGCYLSTHGCHLSAHIWVITYQVPHTSCCTSMKSEWSHCKPWKNWIHIYRRAYSRTNTMYIHNGT
jgi:hypothetical protein